MWNSFVDVIMIKLKNKLILNICIFKLKSQRSPMTVANWSSLASGHNQVIKIIEVTDIRVVSVSDLNKIGEDPMPEADVNFILFMRLDNPIHCKNAIILSLFCYYSV